MGNNQSGGGSGGGGASPHRPSTYQSDGNTSRTFQHEAQPPTAAQSKKLFKNRAKNVNMKEYHKGASTNDIGVTQYSPPRDGGMGKFYEKVVDRLGHTKFWRKWTNGER